MKPKIIFIDSVHPHLPKELENIGFDCVQAHDFSELEIKKNLHLYSGIVIRSRFKIDANVINSATNLSFIARVGSGMENIDVLYAEKKGIKCIHAPEGNKDAVAEHALGMLLSLMHNIKKSSNQIQQGKWLREENRGIELGEKTIGIIGFGNTGSAFAEKLIGFKAKILAYDKYKTKYAPHYVTETSLEEIKAKADIISLHIPLTPKTTYLVDKLFLDSCKKNIYFINTSRGKVLNTKDLITALNTGKVIGACLDVLEFEKTSFEAIDKEQNDIITNLVNNDRVILTPHIAGWTHESNHKMANILIQKIKELYGL